MWEGKSFILKPRSINAMSCWNSQLKNITVDEYLYIFFTSCSVSSGEISTLDHEFVNDSVKFAARVALALGSLAQLYEIFNSFWQSLAKESKFYVTNSLAAQGNGEYNLNLKTKMLSFYYFLFQKFLNLIYKPCRWPRPEFRTHEHSVKWRPTKLRCKKLKASFLLMDVYTLYKVMDEIGLIESLESTRINWCVQRKIKKLSIVLKLARCSSRIFYQLLYFSYVSFVRRQWFFVLPMLKSLT